jgi:predicted aspartyl protease
MHYFFSSSFRFHAILAAITCATCTTACGQHSLAPPDKVELSAPMSVPMESSTGLPVVSARINGRGPYKFIIDTGAMHSVFSENLARELGLPSIAHAAMGRPGSTKPLPATVTRVAKIEIGSLTIEGVTAVFADLSAVFLKKAPDVQGVLSAAMVPGLLVTYNFPAREIEFRHGELPSEDGQTIFVWSAGNLPSLTADVGGQSVRMDVDTGAISGFVVDTAVANKLQWLEAPSEGEKIRTVDMETKTFTGRMNGIIRVGKFSFENPRLVYHDGFNNLGSAVLKDFVVTLDPKNRRLELKRD